MTKRDNATELRKFTLGAWGPSPGLKITKVLLVKFMDAGPSVKNKEKGPAME